MVRLTGLPVEDALGAGLRRGDRRPRGRSGHPDRDHHPRARAAHRVPRGGRRGGRRRSASTSTRRSRSEPDRIDIRERFTFTIDPVDARDFDDAISLEHADDGRVRLGVHIADVSHYVPWDSSIDNEARLRATSVYLVDRVLPMLPEELSNGICSLNPGEDRVSFSVDMTLSKDGAVEEYRDLPVGHALRPAVLDYGAGRPWLSGDEPFPGRARASRRSSSSRGSRRSIGERRVARGGLDFETVEAKVRLDADGKPLEVVLRERTVATNLIEEAMIAANEVVARHMRDAKAPMIYRIHEDPDPEALDRIALVLKEFDYPIKDIHGASPATFQRIVKFAHGRPEKLPHQLAAAARARARALRRLPRAALRPGQRGVHALHEPHPALPRPHRPPAAQGAAPGHARDRPERRAAWCPNSTWLAEHSSHMEREAEMAENDSVRFKLCELMARAHRRGVPGHHHRRDELRALRPARQHRRGSRARRLADRRPLPLRRAPSTGSSARSTGSATGSAKRVNVRIVNVSLGDSRIDMELALIRAGTRSNASATLFAPLLQRNRPASSRRAMLGVPRTETREAAMYDIAIVGAGPAGSTLARLLGDSYRVSARRSAASRSGTHRRDAAGKPCGGLLAPAAQHELARQGLGVPATCRRRAAALRRPDARSRCRSRAPLPALLRQRRSRDVRPLARLACARARRDRASAGA